MVFGSGGIIPDTLVEQKKLSLPLRALFGRDVFFQFANIEYPKLKKRKVKITKKMKIDETTMKSFYSFIDSLKFEYQSLAQLRFTDFKFSAGLKDSVDSIGKPVEIYPEVPDWNEEEKKHLNELMGKVDKMLQKESKRALSSNESDIKKYVREAIMIREFGQDNETIYREKLSDDRQLQAALQLLANEEQYKALLQPGSDTTEKNEKKTKNKTDK